MTSNSQSFDHQQTDDIYKEEESSMSSTNAISTGDEATTSTSNSLVQDPTIMDPFYRELLKLTESAADELYEMASSDSPLWEFDHVLGVELLDKAAYANRFMNTSTQPLKSEAPRARETLRINSNELVEKFMNVDQWLAMFPNIVSRATIVRKYIMDGNPDASLLVMNAEFGLPTPYPVTRTYNFVRRSKQVNEGMWVIVDVSIDTRSSKCYRKPSGCIIEQVDDGYSKISWVEHNELMPEGSLPSLFKEHVLCGFAFHVMRWTMMLKRQIMIQNLITQNINANNAGQSRLLRLAHRMSQMCIRRMNTPTEKTWNLMTSLGYAGIDIFTTSEQYENNLGRPGGTITTVATSISFPFVSADKLYDHLRCGVCRPKWDVSILGASARQEFNIEVGNDSSAYISMLHIEIPGMEPVKSLQLCTTDSNGMYIVWSNLKRATLDTIMEGEDPDAVGILVSGVAVLPSDPTIEGEGSILTVSFESLDESKGNSVQQDAVKSTITNTISLVTDLCTSPYEGHGCDQ